MKTRFEYDSSAEPPVPVLPLYVAVPRSDQGVLVPGIVDTGADCSLIPEAVARRLRLPEIDRINVRGVTGARTSAVVYAASIQLGPLSEIARVVALGDEAIIGRDLLNRLVLELDGPKRTLNVRVGAARAKKRKAQG